MMKIGIFGGSFDPIHQSHIRVIEEALKQLKDDVNIVIHEMFDETTINGELISKTDNKATGIQYAIDYLNIDIKDTIAFGDSMNDYEMIDFVDHGVVMANGNAKLKEIASSICKSVDEDGVYDGFVHLGII